MPRPDLSDCSLITCSMCVAVYVGGAWERVLKYFGSFEHSFDTLVLETNIARAFSIDLAIFQDLIPKKLVPKI